MKFLTRKLVTHEDLNPRGYLHGGQLLKWIDEEGGIHAGLELNTGLIVTKYISDIDFKFPVILGDVIEIGANEAINLKFKDGLDAADIHAATSTGTVRCTICAILDDVA